jgi:hypothetical protein
MSELEANRYNPSAGKGGWYYWHFKSISEEIFKVQSMPKWIASGPKVGRHGYTLELIVSVDYLVVVPAIATNLPVVPEPPEKEIYNVINQNSSRLGPNVIKRLFS